MLSSKPVKGLSQVQLKGLAEFANKIAAAWFTAGIISPFFTKPKSFVELVSYVGVGLLMTLVALRWSLFLLGGTKL
jgi:hypothetical protein